MKNTFKKVLLVYFFILFYNHSFILADESTPSADEATPAADEATPAADEATPAADEATPAADEAKAEGYVREGDILLKILKISILVIIIYFGIKKALTLKKVSDLEANKKPK